MTVKWKGFNTSLQTMTCIYDICFHSTFFCLPSCTVLLGNFFDKSFCILILWCLSTCWSRAQFSRVFYHFSVWVLLFKVLLFKTSKCFVLRFINYWGLLGVNPDFVFRSFRRRRKISLQRIPHWQWIYVILSNKKTVLW